MINEKIATFRNEKRIRFHCYNAVRSRRNGSVLQGRCKNRNLITSHKISAQRLLSTRRFAPCRSVPLLIFVLTARSLARWLFSGRNDGVCQPPTPMLVFVFVFFAETCAVQYYTISLINRQMLLVDSSLVLGRSANDNTSTLRSSSSVCFFSYL